MSKTKYPIVEFEICKQMSPYKVMQIFPGFIQYKYNAKTNELQSRDVHYRKYSLCCQSFYIFWDTVCWSNICEYFLKWHFLNFVVDKEFQR